ncbi:MAG: NAD(P)/FAD-dependent oxidoreductase [Anaerosomatales bacterium]|nr:NAD(P)/FAD-dependent oxidoreductase [Anaerosomatales bacterium]
MQTCTSPTEKRRIVIAGGGYAGTTLAVRLAKRIRPSDDVEILLIEPNPCQQALSELDLVAVGPPRPEFCELWLPTIFKDLPVTVCYNRVHAVLPDEHAVLVGPREGPHEKVLYWRLVLATGAVAFVPPVPGLKEHATTIWSVHDAQELQERIQQQFRIAAKTVDREARARALSFAVIGGGATGIEIVGTMAQMLPKRMLDHGLDPRDLHVHLVEGRPDILYDLPESLRRKAKAHLARLKVELHLGSMVSSVDDEGITLENGARVPASVVVFCGGAKADPDATTWGLAADPSGRLTVDESLHASGRSDIYAIGDVAAFRDPETKRTLPMLAQFAIREAEHTADNLLRELRGQEPEPFRPHMHGEFVSIGPSYGVGWAFRFHLSGIPAIIMKRFTYAMYWYEVGGLRIAWKRLREMLAMQR